MLIFDPSSYSLYPISYFSVAKSVKYIAGTTKVLIVSKLIAIFHPGDRKS